MPDLRKPSLNPWWQDKLNDSMEKHYPDVIGYCDLVDCWKRDGWNDGTTTLHGVYRDNEGVFLECRFPDYGDPTCQTVHPVVEHVGWADKAAINDKEAD